MISNFRPELSIFKVKASSSSKIVALIIAEIKAREDQLLRLVTTL